MADQDLLYIYRILKQGEEVCERGKTGTRKEEARLNIKSVATVVR